MSYNFKLVLQLLSSPSRLIGFIALHTFGISLIYPGSTSFLFYLSKLILNNNIEILCNFMLFLYSGSEFTEWETNINHFVWRPTI